MLYAIICNDKPDHLALRMERRQAHIEYLQSLGDRLKIAGPFITEDGEGMTGSLLVVEAESEDAAQKLAAGDPFAQAGLFATSQVRPWKWTFGNPEA